MVVLGAEPQWWLETSSHSIEILNPNKVTIEAASHDLLVRHKAPVVAVSFIGVRGMFSMSLAIFGLNAVGH